MCKLSLKFEYFYDRDDTDYFDFKQQVRVVAKELYRKLNQNKDFKYCEIEKCCIGQSGFCHTYKYVYFLKVFIFKIEFSPVKPHYRFRMRLFDVSTNTYVDG